ncbi:MAG: host-nuclease inhibitor Gam family protein [Melioribacteraceae bacterium]
MIDNKNFIDELLEEVEAKETSLHLAHVDLILAEIGSIEEQISKNFEETEKEKQILDDWTLRKNSKLQERIDWMVRKLESFMNDQGENIKTIELPNGKLLRRKQPTRIEITSIDEFMQNENLNQLGTLHPEILKPNINMIKAFINSYRKIPRGVRVIDGTEKFTIKLKNKKEEEDGETEVRTRHKSAIENTFTV